MDPEYYQALNELRASSGFFFFFRGTIFVLEYMHRSYFMLYANHHQNPDDNVNNQNNNQVENRNDINDPHLIINAGNNDLNNNENHQVLEMRDPNEEIRDANYFERENRRPSKCCFFTVVLVCLFIVWFVMLFVNGFLLLTMIRCLSILFSDYQQASGQRLKSSRCLIFSSFILLWFIFYLPGIMITTFWFSFSVLYLFWITLSR